MEAYQDANRHPEAVEIARDLCQRDPNEQRYATKRFVSCQALGLTAEMREIVNDLTGRRRKLFDESIDHMDRFRGLVRERVKAANGDADEAKIEKLDVLELHPSAQPDPDEPFKPVLTPEERKEMVKWRNLRRYQPTVIDYLQAQVLTAERRWDEALAALSKVGGVHMARPGLLLHAAELYRHLGKIDQADQTYRRAMEIDPDNVQANLGLCRLALRRKDFTAAAEFGRQAIGKLYFFPMAHFLMGVSHLGLGEFDAAAAEFRTALSQNPHFPQAHAWLGRLLRNHFADPVGAYEHFAQFRAMREFARKRRVAHQAPVDQVDLEAASQVANVPAETASTVVLPPLGDAIVVVSGLPRSGTSMLMQMLEAGGMPILSDRRREADEDNPQGYLELEAVKATQADQSWVASARGKAVKVVAPLVTQLPTGREYRVILLERGYDEVLQSQAKMISRNKLASGSAIQDTPERRQRLMREYDRIMQRTRLQLSARKDTVHLILRYEDIIANPSAAAERLDRFLGQTLDRAAMAASVNPALYRNRSPGKST